MIPRRILVVVAILATVALCGCAAPSRSSESSSGATIPTQAQETSSQPVAKGGPGTYVVELNGTVVRVEVPVPESDKELLEVDAYRKLLEVGDASYMKLTIDNTNGTETFRLDSAKAVSADGEQVELKSGRQALGEWLDEWITGKDLNNNSLYEKGLKMLNARGEQTDVLPGAKSSALLVSDLKSSEVGSIWVNGGEASLSPQ